MFSQYFSEMHSEITRAGIIPYTIARGTVWILLTEDLKTGEKGDFGGGRKEKESVYEAACREAEEESSGILKMDPLKEFEQPKLSIVHKNSLIYFIPTTFYFLRDSKRIFDQKGGNKEVKTLHVVKLNDIWSDSNNDMKMWVRIKAILMKNRRSLSFTNLSNIFYN